jgi:hypothetical protein
MTTMQPQEYALVEEGARKSGLVWVNGQAVWHVWLDGAVHVVTGGATEQPAPRGLGGGEVVEVGVRSKDKGGRLVTWHGRAEVVEAGTDAWAAAVAELRPKRLNAEDADAMGERWARECTLYRITPEGAVEGPERMPDGSGAEPPRPTPATTRRPMPAGLPKLLARRKRR